VALVAGSLVATRTYEMFYDGAIWDVRGLPFVRSSSVVADGGYESRGDGSKFCYGEITVPENDTAVFDLPIEHSQFVRVTLGVFVNANGTNSQNIGIDAIIRDAQNRPTGVRVSNTSTEPAAVHVHTIGK
jgi:hypothetical protein